MADQVRLATEPRAGRGKGEARRLRRAGRVPAVAYGSGLEPTPVSVDGLELYHALRTDAGLNALIRLSVDGDTHLTLARELQRHPVRRDILHVDFVAVDRTQKVAVEVPIVLTGEAPGADEGGVVDHVLFTASVEVLPLDVPDQIELDVSDMQLGDVKRLEDLPLPEGVDLLEDPERTVVSVYVPQMDVPEPETEGVEEEPLAEAAAEEADAVGGTSVGGNESEGGT
jgi:large subunit ribosomal protein L25